MAELPVLFVSHGSPMLALEKSPTSAFLTNLGGQVLKLPNVKAIVIVSAHWETHGTIHVNTSAKTSVIHDFYGFPSAMYKIKYPARGHPDVARRAIELLRRAGIAATEDASHGLDHGAWVPLHVMLPQADIPVVQLSLLAGGSMRDHVAVGEALSVLRDEGVLLICSGTAVHNLQEIRKYLDNQKVPEYVGLFDDALDAVALETTDASDRKERAIASSQASTSHTGAPPSLSCGHWRCWQFAGSEASFSQEDEHQHGLLLFWAWASSMNAPYVWLTRGPLAALARLLWLRPRDEAALVAPAAAMAALSLLGAACCAPPHELRRCPAADGLASAAAEVPPPQHRPSSSLVRSPVRRNAPRPFRRRRQQRRDGCFVVAKNQQAYTLSEEETSALQRKAAEVVDDLRGTSIFLVGMMGSGKTTVGRILADALHYSFLDCDQVVEQVAGGASVAEIFAECGEEVFRQLESKVIAELSSNGRLVVATGGGAVTRPTNWSKMRDHVTVWLDVPVGALADRLLSAGTKSRPLLNRGETTEVEEHSKLLQRLNQLLGDRRDMYAQADATLRLEDLATSLGLESLSSVSSGAVALEALEKVNALINSKKYERRGTTNM
eukprot:SM000008S22383  [mRNA]  locus=s8:1288898:1297240:+ [translate_table: standard]